MPLVVISNFLYDEIASQLVYIDERLDPGVYIRVRNMDAYMSLINSREFREANKLTHKSVQLLENYGLTKEKAREWIRAWVSGAGDGAE